MPDMPSGTTSLPHDVTIRCAQIADVHTLCSFRTRMFVEMGWSDMVRLEQLEVAYAEYLRETLSSGEAAGWIAESDMGAGGSAVPIAGACLVWKRVPPSLRNPDGREAYLLGVFVDQAWRRRGIARQLVSSCVEEAREQGAAVVTLHASDEGRRLYDGMGFVDSHEMRLFTEHAPAPAWAPAYDAD
jgi:ribosomal protein S18 acetylase RimI-like enzyme